MPSVCSLWVGEGKRRQRQPRNHGQVFFSAAHHYSTMICFTRHCARQLRAQRVRLAAVRRLPIVRRCITGRRRCGHQALVQATKGGVRGWPRECNLVQQLVAGEEHEYGRRAARSWRAVPVPCYGAARRRCCPCPKQGMPTSTQFASTRTMYQKRNAGVALAAHAHTRWPRRWSRGTHTKSRAPTTPCTRTHMRTLVRQGTRQLRRQLPLTPHSSSAAS